MIPLGLLDGDNGPSWSVTGGTITSDGTYYYHTFDTTSGELVVEGRDVPIEYLLVGTGGSGGGASTYYRSDGGWDYYVGPGGGGAGGVLTGSTFLAPGTYPITIGAPKYSTEGAVADTTAFGLTAYGGGHGAVSDAVDGYALSGGSGGGGSQDVFGPFLEYGYAGYGEPGQGNDGGNALRVGDWWLTILGGGGGGGAGGVGQTSTSPGSYVQGDGSTGGAGIQVWGDWYAAGGGGFPATKRENEAGGAFYYGAPGFGGTGGGGISGTNGADSATPPTTPGSGGGGCNVNNGSNHWGAMGIVRIRYPMVLPDLDDLPTVIGEPAFGGFYAGIIDTTQPGAITPSDQYQEGLRYALIVAPKSLELSGRSIEWRLARRGTQIAAQTRWNGLAAQEAYAFSDFPAFNYCDGLSFPDDGGSKWYLPAMDELELVFRNFKAFTQDNEYLVSNVSYVFPPSSEGLPTGQNPSSDPQGTAYTATVPGLTTVDNFKEYQPEYFASDEYWTSTWANDTDTWTMNMCWGEYRDKSPDSQQALRPVRRVLLPPAPPPVAEGGTVTTADGYIVHTFTSSGDFTVLAGASEVEYLIVGAGGPGGYSTWDPAGDGGAGGWVHATATLTAGVYPVVVGSGSEVYEPTPGLFFTSGRPSTFNGATAYGGGAGGGIDDIGGDAAGAHYTNWNGGTAMGSGGGNGAERGQFNSGGLTGRGYTNGGFGSGGMGFAGAGGGAAGNANGTTPGNGIITMGISHSKGGEASPTQVPPQVPPYGRGGGGGAGGSPVIDGGPGIVVVRYPA